MPGSLCKPSGASIVAPERNLAMAGQEIIGQWVPPGNAPGELETVAVDVMVRRDGTALAVGLFEPGLEEDVGELRAIIRLPARDALGLLDKVLWGLDQMGHGAGVAALLRCREHAAETH